MLPAGLDAASPGEVINKKGQVRSETISLGNLDSRSQYSLLYSVEPLRSLTAESRIMIELRQGSGVLASKTLHAGDPDYYTQFRVPRTGAVTLDVRAHQPGGSYELQVNRWPLSPLVKSVPNHRWQDAVAIPLGKTIFASGDDEEYIPLPGTSRREVAERAGTTDWYKFEFTSDSPKLIFFQIDLMERDQIPVDVSVYRLAGGRP